MTWQELEIVGFSPKKADPELNGDATTLSGTPVRTTLPLTMRQPFLMTGAAVIVMFKLRIYVVIHFYLQLQELN